MSEDEGEEEGGKGLEGWRDRKCVRAPPAELQAGKVVWPELFSLTLTFGERFFSWSLSFFLFPSRTFDRDGLFLVRARDYVGGEVVSASLGTLEGIEGQRRGIFKLVKRPWREKKGRGNGRGVESALEERE